MTTLLVSGGAGFIGSNFVRHVFDHTAADLVVVDKLTYAGSLLNLEPLLSSPRVRFVRADIADPAAMSSAFGTYRPSAVVNLAAETHVDRSIDGPAPFVQTNVVGTFVLLEAALEFSRQLDPERREAFRFVHVSTDEVYGTLGVDGFFSESTAIAPRSPYAASKAAGDHLVGAYFHTYGLPTVVTHSSNNYGPFQFPEKLVPLMILNAMEGRPLPVYGDGGHIRDWLHVEDHCQGLLLALEHGRVGERYNIGGGNERTNLEVVEEVCDLLDNVRPAHANPALRGAGSYRALITHVADRPGHDRRYALDSDKIQRELGWTPYHDFESGLRETVDWYLDHRDWCARVQAGRYGRERLGLSR